MKKKNIQERKRWTTRMTGPKGEMEEEGKKKQWALNYQSCWALGKSKMNPWATRPFSMPSLSSPTIYEILRFH